LVAIIQAIKEMVHQMRQDGDQILLCIAECLIGCIESLMEYFNKWAFGTYARKDFVAAIFSFSPF
jgi:hypothetical protein